MIASHAASVVVSPLAVQFSTNRREHRSAELAGEVQALCARVEKLRRSIETNQAVGSAAQAIASVPDEARALTIAREALAIRRRRERLFGPDLFSEPAWDILLELYIAHAEGVDVPVGNACLAASVPMTSALRWCQILQDRHIVYRERDPKDGRRIFLRMTPESFVKLTSLFNHEGGRGLAPLAE
jgi:DNA-binding MarR family transcriptional regulator